MLRYSVNVAAQPSSGTSTFVNCWDNGSILLAPYRMQAYAATLGGAAAVVSTNQATTLTSGKGVLITQRQTASGLAARMVARCMC